MKTNEQAPDMIWLQWHGDSDESEIGPVNEDEVTHCRDKVFDRDIGYVRADLHDDLRATLKEIYNTAAFDWDTMPEEGRRRFRGVVQEFAANALNPAQAIAI